MEPSEGAHVEHSEGAHVEPSEGAHVEPSEAGAHAGCDVSAHGECLSTKFESMLLIAYPEHRYCFSARQSLLKKISSLRQSM